ncbi:MAG: putative lipid II flippase FtsW [Bacteroidota bacterium]|nr:putative lipid II flippase FtsW [Bacteroidota bacterium]
MRSFAPRSAEPNLGDTNMTQKNNHIDRIILFVVLFLMVASTVVVYSASSMWALQKYGASSHLVDRHIIKVLVGIAAMFLAMRIDYHNYKKISKIALAACVLLLFITLALGGEVKGAQRWLNIGGFSFQPSEFARFALIFHLSALLASKKEKAADYKTGFLPLVLWIGVVVVLVMLQPNFSTGVFIFVLGMVMVFIGGAQLKHIAVSLLALLPVVIVYMISAEYRLRRILTFLGKDRNTATPSRANYQLWQGIIGFGNGGWLGVGMGQSKQRDLFLPESYGDFVFSIVGEEYGFIGTVLFLGLFLTIFLRGFRIAKNARDDFGRYLAIGITCSIVMYALGNALVTLGLFPTTGLPMPFVSYGGSAIVISSFAIGVLLNISSQTDLHPRLTAVEGADVSELNEPAVGKVY